MDNLKEFFKSLDLELGLVRGMELTEEDITEIITVFDDSMDIQVEGENGDNVIELMVVDNKYVDIDKMTTLEYDGYGY